MHIKLLKRASQLKINFRQHTKFRHKKRDCIEMRGITMGDIQILSFDKNDVFNIYRV